MKGFLVGLAIAGLTSFSGRAAVIGIVDSGNDMEHQELVATAWSNPGEVGVDNQGRDKRSNGVDDESNGYVDDVHGWNFANNNKVLVDRSLIGTFSRDVYTFFEVQGRQLRGTATDADRQWIASRRADQNFIQELQKFGNFAHGTHVQGISTKDVANNQMIGLKLIGGSAAEMFRSTLPFQLEALGIPSIEQVGPFQDALLRMMLRTVAGRQGQAMAPIGDYLAKQSAKAANCSFGIGHKQAVLIVEQLGSSLNVTMTDAEKETYATFFVEEILASQATNFTGRSTGTLFVMAAGNDAADNDTKPSAPTNIRADNVISVAATVDRVQLASFSNFGATKVDVAAPGVGIRSTSPGNEHVEMSGTSQAAPYVTRAAGLIVNANAALTVAEVKRILKETVDVKDWLRGKVETSGIVNPERAERAAQLSMTMSLDQAIRMSKNEISDLSVGRPFRTLRVNDAEIVPVSLSPLFE